MDWTGLFLFFFFFSGGRETPHSVIDGVRLTDYGGGGRRIPSGLGGKMALARIELECIAGRLW